MVKDGGGLGQDQRSGARGVRREGRGRGEHRASKWRRHPSHSTRCPHPNRTCNTIPLSLPPTRVIMCMAQQHLEATCRAYAAACELHAYPPNSYTWWTSAHEHLTRTAHAHNALAFIAFHGLVHLEWYQSMRPSQSVNASESTSRSECVGLNQSVRRTCLSPHPHPHSHPNPRTPMRHARTRARTHSRMRNRPGYPHRGRAVPEC